MRVVSNERHIRVRSFIGKYASLAGIAVLLGGLIVSFTAPERFAVTMGCMALGVLLSLIGSFFAGRYTGPLAHHEALAAALKGLSNRHVLLSYVLPASQVLLEPGGLTVLVAKTHDGQVTYQENGRWKHSQRGKILRQMAGQEGVGAPDLEAERQAAKLKAWLAERLPDTEIPVRAAIVFVNPNVDLDAANSPVPTFHAKKIKAWLRGPGRLKPLPAAVYRQLATVLGAGTE